MRRTLVYTAMTKDDALSIRTYYEAVKKWGRDYTDRIRVDKA
jgi:hypothetical protein